MALPVVPLSSLASRVVLAHDLDTRELPRHLHRQMEQYRSLRGDFSLLSVDLQVQWKDNEEASEKQRTHARGFLDKYMYGDMIRDSGLEMKPNGKNRWTSTKVDEHKIPVHFKEDPLAILNSIDGFHEYRKKHETANVTLSKYGHLENGRLVIVSKKEKFWPKVGITTVSSIHSSFEIDETDCFVWVQKMQNSHIEPKRIITIRKARMKIEVEKTNSKLSSKACKNI